MFKKEKKNKSAKKKSAYSSKIHEFINKLLDSPERELKESLDKCNTHPKKEESKLEPFVYNVKTPNTLSTFISPLKTSSPDDFEFNKVELFEGCIDQPESKPLVGSIEKISLKKCFFKDCFNKKVKLSEVLKKDSQEFMDSKLQKIMKEVMESPSIN
jgi:hypothetical protein